MKCKKDAMLRHSHKGALIKHGQATHTQGLMLGNRINRLQEVCLALGRTTTSGWPALFHYSYTSADVIGLQLAGSRGLKLHGFLPWLVVSTLS